MREVDRQLFWAFFTDNASLFAPCSLSSNLEDDVYSFGFILLESLVGPLVTGKEETFLLNEMVSSVSLTFQIDEFFSTVIYNED